MIVFLGHQNYLFVLPDKSGTEALSEPAAITQHAPDQVRPTLGAGLCLWWAL